MKQKVATAMSIPLFFSFLLFLHPPPSSADSFYHFCDSTGSYNANSTYATNLNFLLSSIPTNTSSNSGFYKSSTGSIPNQVSVLALCRGDTSSSACLSCLDVAIQDAAQLCPYYKSVTIYYDPCLLSYSNQVFLNSTDNSHQVFGWNLNNVSDTTLFDEFVNYLMNKTADSASYNSSDKVRYSTAQVTFDKEESYTIYGLEQCTPDLTKDECRKCLEDLINSMPEYFSGRRGGRILGVRCTLRYEVYTFYDGASKLMLEPPTAENAPAPAPVVPRPATPASPGEGKKNSTGTILAITIPIVAALSLVSLICLCLWRKRLGRRILLSHQIHAEDVESVESLLLDLSTLRVATDNFAEINKLGEGGFGAVYKGVLPDGQEIAAKRLSKNSGQGLGELKN